MEPEGALQPSPAVAHVVLSLNVGGLERLVCNLAAAAPLRGLRVVAYCLDERGALAGELEKNGGRVELIRRGPGYFDVTVVSRLAEAFRADRIGVVHTHSLDPMLYAGLAARRAGVPIRIHTQHNTFAARYDLKDRLKLRLAARFFQRVVGVSRETTRTLAPMVPAPRLLTIVNGVDADRFGAARVRVERGRDGPGTGGTLVVGTVARLAPEKGVDVLLRAFAGVRAAVPTAQLVIAGDGPERQRLEALARELGLAETVRFLGVVAAVEELLPTFDLFVLPSRSEGIPVSLLEAMAARRPIVATRVGGVPEVLSAASMGRLVPAEDQQALRKAIVALLQRPDERDRMAAEAERRVRSALSLEAMAAAYRRLYVADRPEGAVKRVAKAMFHALPRRRLLWSGAPGRQRIALTFDDGPEPETTPQLLDLLRRFGVKATFFLVGANAEAAPELVRRIVEEGHEVGSHSHTHPDFERLTWSEALVELARSGAVLERLQGAPCRLFRPPKGKLCVNSVLGAWRSGHTVVMWSADFKDFRAISPVEILAAMDERPLRDGDIVLYHAASPASLSALPAVLEAALEDGRVAVPVSQMIA